MQVGNTVRHVREPQRGLGEIKLVQAIAGEQYAFVGWPNEPGALKQHPLGDLETIVPLTERLQTDKLGPAVLNRFLLRVLGRWFEARNALTGELSNQPFQMLPHQVLVANRVINSDPNLRRWLIADDVGLGKTIEAGMIMEVLRKRSLSGRFRCLVVAPAGLVTQWQEEMRVRFGRYFAQLKDDINQLQHAPLLIASIDTLKNQKKYGDALRTVEPWDLVIVDEAHHLASEKSIERYKFADGLLRNKENPKARNVLFLTATPHSGNSGHFVNMLQLLREDLFKTEEDATRGDGRLNKVMIRNRKSDVQDAKGARLFFGVTSQVIECAPPPVVVHFFVELSAYRGVGYGVAADLKKKKNGSGQGNAVGFLMTTFRKLASSSRGAIRSALARRRAVLAGDGVAESAPGINDERYEGEQAEKDAAFLAIQQSATKKGKKTAQSYMDNELAQVDLLLRALDKLGEHDSKLDKFLKWVKSLPTTEKVLVFTEYRGTQSSLQAALSGAFGQEAVGLVNGDMKLQERRDIVRAFNETPTPRFLISTEAGGEGLNMQKSCHILVNYDLPWNPIRLQQRIGRVYRYGQKKPVQVFNFKLHLHGSEAFVDARVEELLRAKIREIALRYAEVQKESVEDVEGEVLGTVVSNVNIDELYEQALTRGEAAAKQTLDKKSAVVEEIMRDPKGMLGLFHGLKRFNLMDYETVSARVRDEQLDFFLHQYIAESQQQPQLRETQDGLLSFPVSKTLREYADRMAREDPSEVREPLGERVERVTVSKDKATQTLNCRLLRFGDIAFDAMVQHVQSSNFSDGVASLTLPAKTVGWEVGDRGTCVVFDLKVLQQTGTSATLLRNDLAAYSVRRAGSAVEAETVFESLIKADRGKPDVDVVEVKRAYPLARGLAEKALATVREQVLKERGATDGIVLVIDDYALAWVEAV